MAPPPPDLDAGYTAWSLAGENGIFGKHNDSVQFGSDNSISFDIGASVDLPLVHLKPRNVDRAWDRSCWPRLRPSTCSKRESLKAYAPLIRNTI